MTTIPLSWINKKKRKIENGERQVANGMVRRNRNKTVRGAVLHAIRHDMSSFWHSFIVWPLRFYILFIFFSSSYRPVSQPVKCERKQNRVYIPIWIAHCYSILWPVEPWIMNNNNFVWLCVTPRWPIQYETRQCEFVKQKKLPSDNVDGCPMAAPILLCAL